MSTSTSKVRPMCILLSPQPASLGPSFKAFLHIPAAHARFLVPSGNQSLPLLKHSDSRHAMLVVRQRVLSRSQSFAASQGTFHCQPVPNTSTSKFSLRPIRDECGCQRQPNSTFTRGLWSAVHTLSIPVSGITLRTHFRSNCR